MKVYTKSGSCYMFLVYEGSLRTQYGVTEVIVNSIENLEVGKSMIVKGHELDMYCQVKHSLFQFTTSPIVRIES